MSGENTATQKVKGALDGVPTGVPGSGQSGYGTFDLGGRSIGKGGLPRPAYNSQAQGKVVIKITVNPEGYVLYTDVDLKSTNIQDLSLHNAALKAAKKAKFVKIDGVDNQVGTITYFFNLKVK